MADNETVLMAHGSGGTMMRDIIEQLFFEAYAGDTLKTGDDAAVLPIPADRLAFSTDTFVVTPHFFPGGDIGHLAVCGTVNDVATSGAIPRYLSCAFVLEEGYPLDKLRRICASFLRSRSEKIDCSVSRICSTARFILTFILSELPPKRKRRIAPVLRRTSSGVTK